MQDLHVHIKFNRKISAGVQLMGLQLRGELPQMLPGQFVMLRVGKETDPLLRRPFSICGVAKGGILLILYKIVGKATSIMGEMSQGDELELLGPLGNGFHIPAKDKKPILVAGGIGIAPLIFLAKEMETRGIEFLLGFNTSSEIIWPTEIGVKDQHVQVATEDGSEGHKGLVTDLLRQKLESDGTRDLIVYACGPMAMLKEVAHLCFKYAIPCKVCLETTMACGLGACLGCAVKRAEDSGYHYVCKDGPVFDSLQIKWE